MLENIRLSLRGIWNHKMRSFLTMLGIIIGIASILAIVSIVQGTNEKLQKSLVGEGNNVVNVVLYDSSDQEASWNYTSEDSIPLGFQPVSKNLLKSIEKEDHALHAAAYCARENGDASIYYRDQALSNSALYGIDGNYFRTISARLLTGRVFSEKEVKSAEKICVINQKAASFLFGSPEAAIGKVIEIKTEPFAIIGVVNTDSGQSENYEDESAYYSAAYSQGGAGKIFVPLGSWPLLYYFDEPESVAVHVDQTTNMKEVGKQTAELLNDTVSGGNSLQYKAKNTDDSEGQLKTLTNAITAMLVSIASLSLLVGGIGVMNIMLVSVSERTAEIGLKKALGARPKEIRGQFLTESAVLTSVGGVLGVIIGMILGRIIALFLNLDFAISIPWILIAVGFSVGVGLLFGFLPARKAAKMNPIDALRRE